MGITNQEMSTKLFDEDLKKPGAKSINISKKNLFFLAFAVMILQVADTGLLWIMGASKNSNFAGDTFFFSVVIFGFLKCVYDKCFKPVKVLAEEEPIADEVQEEVMPEDDCCQSASFVVDTMKVKGPPRSTRIVKKKPSTESKLQPVTIWVSSLLRPPSLNPKAKKFVPLCTHVNVLDSDAPVFMPKAHTKKEEKILKSQSGGTDAGEVVWRSQHWVNDIGSPEKQEKPKDVPKKSKSTLTPEKAALDYSAFKKEWRPKVKWASAWSGVKAAISI